LDSDPLQEAGRVGINLLWQAAREVMGLLAAEL